MGKIKKTARFCTSVLLMLLLSSCTEREIKSGPAETYVIGVATKSGMSEYWMSVCLGMEAAAQELGAQVLVLSPDSEADEEAQIKMVETLIRRDADVLAISPIDSYDTPKYFELAREKGIQIISYDSGFADAAIPYIGIDNEKAGYELAAFLAEQLGHQGDVGIITGDLNQICHRQRMEGFVKYMDTEPNMRIVFTESGYSNRQMPEAEIFRLRETYPAVKGIMVTSAVTAMGIVEEIQDGSVKIVSLDAQEDAIEAVKCGRMTGLIAQSGYEIGYQTVRYIDALQKGEAEETRMILDAKLLTRQNVEEYMENVRKDKERKYQESGKQE